MTLCSEVCMHFVARLPELAETQFDMDAWRRSCWTNRIEIKVGWRLAFCMSEGFGAYCKDNIKASAAAEQQRLEDELKAWRNHSLQEDSFKLLGLSQALREREMSLKTDLTSCKAAEAENLVAGSLSFAWPRDVRPSSVWS